MLSIFFLHVKETFSPGFFSVNARRTFFKVVPGEKIMSNEVRVNVTRAGGR